MYAWQALPDQARSWYGKEAWLSLEEFTSMLQSVDYRPLINCESWQVSWSGVSALKLSIIQGHGLNIAATLTLAGAAAAPYSTTYGVLWSHLQLLCHVQATSPMVFPSTRTGERAVQTVEVMAQPSASQAASKRAHTFTFCLEHITQGPYKVASWLQAYYAHAHSSFTYMSKAVVQGCWMTVGLRLGDYANV